MFWRADGINKKINKNEVKVQRSDKIERSEGAAFLPMWTPVLYSCTYIFSIYVDVAIKERNEKPADTIYLSLSLSHPLSPSFELVLQGCSETQML